MKRIPNDIFFGMVEETLAEAGSVRFRVKGCSMQPLLRNERDEVTVVCVGDAPLKRGDIVLFRFAGRHILHRIRRVDGQDFVLCGDNAVNNEYCTRADVLGIVAGIHRSLPSGGFRDSDTSSILNRLWPVTSCIPRLKASFRAVYSIFTHRIG